MRIDLSSASVEDIIKFANAYLGDSFFNTFPDLKDRISVVLTGSIPLGNYDSESDIDLNFIFPEMLFKEYKAKLQEYKLQVVKDSPQVQPFFKDTFEQLQILHEWNDDYRLKEFATAYIILDSENKFSEFQKSIAWYPDDIFKEKIHWLFAELVFELEDRWKVALKRQDLYFIQVTKLRIISLIVNTLFLLNKQYPVGDKQLSNVLKKMPDDKRLLKENALKIINSHEVNKLSPLFLDTRNSLEDELVERELIERNNNAYWINLRPKYLVKI